MLWSISFQLLPDEEIIDDAAGKNYSGIQPAYSVFLTNKRAIFRFDGLGSSLSRSFFYHEIEDVATTKRLFITYLDIKSKHRNSLFHVGDAAYWMNKIRYIKNQSPVYDKPGTKVSSSPDRSKQELMEMLTTLRKHALLNDSELQEKVQRLNAMNL